MHPRFLGARDTLDRDQLLRFFAQTLPGAAVRRDSALMGSVFVDLVFGGLAVTLEAGKANAERGPRVPWMTVTIPLATHGLEIDWIRERNARSFQVPVVREGAFIGTGGPSDLVAMIFGGVRGSLGMLDRNLDRVEIRDGRLVLHVNGWPADSAALWLVLQTAHAIASRTTESLRTFVSSGRTMDTDATLAAYRAGLRRSERIGKLILLGVFGVLIPGVALTTVLGTWLMR